MYENQTSHSEARITGTIPAVTPHLPPGIHLNDVFIDGAQVIAELFISKRTLLNWISTGKISYCDRFGKIFITNRKSPGYCWNEKNATPKKTSKKRKVCR